MSDSSETTPKAPDPAAQQPLPIPPTDDEIAQLRAAAAELAQLRAQEADGKKAAKEAAAKAAKEAEERGELAKSLEHYKAQAAEAESLRAIAAEHSALMASLTADLDKEAESLPEGFRAAYSLQTSLAAKKALLAAARAVQPTSPPAEAQTKKASFPATGQPAVGASVDFSKAFADPMLWAEAKARDPVGAQHFMRARVRGNNHLLT